MQIYIPSKSSKIDLRCAKGSIPSVNVWKVPVHLFLSRLLSSKTVHSSSPDTSRFYWFSLAAVFSLCPQTLLTLTFMCIKKSLVIQHISSTHVVPGTTIRLILQQWPWVLSFQETLMQVKQLMAVILTTHKRSERMGTRGTMVPGTLQVGDCLYGLPEATLHELWRSQSWYWEDSMWPGEEGGARLWLGLSFLPTNSSILPLSCASVCCPMPLPLRGCHRALTALTTHGCLRGCGGGRKIKSL